LRPTSVRPKVFQKLEENKNTIPDGRRNRARSIGWRSQFRAGLVPTAAVSEPETTPLRAPPDRRRHLSKLIGPEGAVGPALRFTRVNHGGGKDKYRDDEHHNQRGKTPA